MPFINERLEANRESIEKNRAASGPVRASRFRFEPDAVMSGLRENIVGQDDALTAMESMLDIELASINRRLAKKHAELSLSPELREELCRGYDARYGAREMLRAFRQRLEPAVARALLAYPDCHRFEAGVKGREVAVHQYVE